MHFDFGEDSINEGDGVSAQCTVSKGDYPLSIAWTLNDVPANKIAGILIGRVSKRVSTLTIDSVKAEHVGNYTCIASNKAANTSFTTILAVNGLLQFRFFFSFLKLIPESFIK